MAQESPSPLAGEAADLILSDLTAKITSLPETCRGPIEADIARLSALIRAQNHRLLEQEQIEKELRENEKIYRAIGETIDYGVWISDPDGRNLLQISRLKQTEQALRESQERLADFLESTHDHIYALDQNWKYIFANQRYCQLRGVDPKTIIGMDFWEVNSSYLGTEIEAHLRKAMQERVPVYFQTAGKYSAVWFDLSVYPTRDGISIFAKDRTEAYRAEQALRESEQKFQAIFEHAPFAIALTRAADGVTVDINQTFVDMMGFEKDEVIGKTSLELGVVPDPETRRRLIEEVRQQGFARNHELVYRTKSGQPLMVSANADKLTIGETEYMLGTVENITERKQAEAALRGREAELRKTSEALRARANELEALMDAVPAMIWVTHDPQCREMIGNRAGNEILSEGPGANVSSTAPHEVLSQQKYHNMKDGQIIPADELPMQVAAAQGKPARNYTYDIVFDDGTTYHVIGNVNPLFDTEGKPAGAVGAFVDITAMRRLEAEQIAAQTEIEVQRRLMEQREQERQQIARDIHDGPIQTLVSSIFNLQMTKEALTDRKLQIELNQIGLSIKSAVQELRQVVNELRPPSILLLGFSRAIQIYAEDFRERHPELELHLHLGNIPRKFSEQTSLTLFRIYQEALNNIIRHAEATRVDVRLTLSENQAVLEVKDNGKGFAMQPDLVRQTEKGHYGMAGMKERAEALNGRLEIKSQPGKGTQVRVVFPLDDETAPAA